MSQNDSPRRRGTSAPGMVPAVIALIAVILAIIGIGAYMMSGGRDSGTRPSQAEQSQSTSAGADSDGGLGFIARRDPGDPMAIGDADAPVVLVNYSDWRCPFCAKYARDIEPTLIDEYVDVGKLRIEWRDMPIFGDESMLAARAGRAAAEQGKFREFHDAVMAAAPERGHPDLTEDILVDFARQAGVPDLAAFRDAMTSDRFDADIRKDAEEGAAYGVNSTPTFIVGDRAVVGAQPLEAFTSAIDAQLPGQAGE